MRKGFRRITAMDSLWKRAHFYIYFIIFTVNILIPASFLSNYEIIPHFFFIM